MVIYGENVDGHITKTWEISATFAFVDETEGLLYTEEGHCFAWPYKVHFSSGDPITFKMNEGWFVKPETKEIVEFRAFMTDLMAA